MPLRISGIDPEGRFIQEGSTTLIRLRFLLIRLLAGRRHIVMNCTIRGVLEVPGDNESLIRNVRFSTEEVRQQEEEVV